MSLDAFLELKACKYVFAVGASPLNPLQRSHIPYSYYMRPDSKTLALYKSCTYLLTYLLRGKESTGREEEGRTEVKGKKEIMELVGWEKKAVQF